MNQELTAIDVTPVGNGVYRVFSLFDKECVAFTAQALLELAAWIAANQETLMLDAEQGEQSS